MARARAIDTRLEKLIPSTDELFVTGILTKEEIQQLVKDRTFHEYKLVARPLLLLDVKNAINFELALEKKIAAYCAEFNRQAALEASGTDENGKKKAKSGAPVKKLQLKHRWAVQERIEQIYRIGLRHLFTQRKTASLLQLKRKATLTTAPLTGQSSSNSNKDAATTEDGKKAGGLKKVKDASDPIDDYELLRRECVSQLKAFSRQISLSKLYAEWLTRAPQDSFLWSEAALFEATNGRNDEARAIIQQALATLRQSSSSSAAAASSTTAPAGSSSAMGAIRLAGKDFVRQRASEESKEVWGTALVIEILFAKRLLEGAIETAVRAKDGTPAESLKGENAALAAIVLDLALCEAIVSDAAQPAEEGHMPFLCPDLGLYLYGVAVCHQFTAGLCRSILLQTLAVATNYTASAAPSAPALGGVTATAGYSPLSALLTELFLTDVRFTATNCVAAEQFIAEKTLADLALLEGKADGDVLRREWVVRHLHRKHRVVPVREKKEKVLSSVGAALTLIVALQTAEKAMKKGGLLSKAQIEDIVAFVRNSSEDEDEEESDNAKENAAAVTSLFTSLLRTIVASAAAGTSNNKGSAALSSLAALRCSLSDAVLELMSLSADLSPIHLDSAQDALRAFESSVKAAKAEEKAQKEKAAAKRKARGGADAEGDDAEAAANANDDAVAAELADPAAFVATASSNIFLFSQAESSAILRIVLLLEKAQQAAGATGKKRALALVGAIEGALANAADVNGQKAVVATSGKKKSAPSASVAAASKQEAAATLQLFRELCVAAALLTPYASDVAAAKAAKRAAAGKKAGAKKEGGEEASGKDLSAEDAAIERANRRIVIKVGTNGAQLLKSFAEVAFANANAAGATASVISQQSVDLATAAGAINDKKKTGGAASAEDAAIDAAFEEDVSPIADQQLESNNNAAAASSDAANAAFARNELWWADASSTSTGGLLAILDTKFLSVRMTPADLVAFLSVAQPAASSAASSAASAAGLDISTREEVAIHVARVLTLIDNEATLSSAAADNTIPKLAAAIQQLVCTPQQKSAASSASAGAYLPYDPSLWRLFGALQHTLSARIRALAIAVAQEEATTAAPKQQSHLTSSSAIGKKTTRAGADSSSDSDSDDEDKKAAPKKKLRIGNNGAAASSATAAASVFASPAATAAAATSVISQREELSAILAAINATLANVSATADAEKKLSPATAHTGLVALARRLFHVSLQIVAGGSSHASLPTADLRVERLKGILALTTVETIRELEAAVDSGADSSVPSSALTFNAPAIFLDAQVLRLQQLFAATAASSSASAHVVHGLLSQLTRIHNLLLPPIRILDLVNSKDALGHGYSTPVTRALLRNVLIPAFGAAFVAAGNVEQSNAGAKSLGLSVAAEKALHSLLSQLTSLYIVEVKESGKFGNGIRNSTQYAVVQKKEVSDHIAQNRPEVFLPFFFPASATDGGFAATGASSSSGAASAAVTKSNITNAQVNDWLLALVFEQQYTRNLSEARATHARAVQTVEAPQTFLAAVAAGSLPALF